MKISKETKKVTEVTLVLTGDEALLLGAYLDVIVDTDSADPLSDQSKDRLKNIGLAVYNEINSF